MTKIAGGQTRRGEIVQEENEMELHAARNKGGHVGKRHASLFRPGVFYTWNFSGIYQEALDFQGEIPSCDFACL